MRCVRTACLALLFGAIGCGDSGGDATTGGGGSGGGDLGGAPDGGGVDGGAGAEGGSGAGGEGEGGHGGDGPGVDVGSWVIDRLEVPLDASTAAMLGFDLNGDGAIDNQMGQIFSAFDEVGNGGFNPQTPFTVSIDTGAILFLGRAATSGEGTAFESFVGVDPDPEPCLDVGDISSCRQHLDGTGSFGVDGSYPTDLGVVGTVSGTEYSGQDGTALLPIAFPGAEPTWVVLERASVELSTISEFEIEGQIGGMISDAQVQDEVLPAFHASVVATMERDCTATGENCGCVASSAGESFQSLFDVDEDCVVTLTEVTTSSLTLTLWSPDVDSDDDGTNDSLSIGVGVTGVRATFDHE